MRQSVGSSVWYYHQQWRQYFQEQSNASVAIPASLLRGHDDIDVILRDIVERRAMYRMTYVSEEPCKYQVNMLLGAHIYVGADT